MIYGAHLIYMRIHFIDVCFKGILQDLTLLSFVLVEICSIFELLCFPPSFPPETRDLCIFLSFFVNRHFASSEDFFSPESKDYSQW